MTRAVQLKNPSKYEKIFEQFFFNPFTCLVACSTLENVSFWRDPLITNDMLSFV
jgi:hypothetical protein